MIIALYKPNKLQLFFAKLVSLLSIKSIEWEGNNNKKFDSIINFPNSKEYTKLMEESRVLLDIFYTERFNSSKHQISNIYFRKSYDLKFLDYYVFRKEVEKKSDLNKKIYCLGGGYRKYIYKKPKLKITKYYLLPWYIFFSYTTLFLYTLKTYISCLFYGANHPIHDVMYLRKKAYPDLGLKDNLCQYLENLNIFNCNSIIQYSKSREKFGFSFLNSLENSKKRVIITALSVLKEVHLIIFLQIMNRIPIKDIGVYIKEIFLAKSVINTKSKIFVGVLVDKPIFTLLYQYKLKNQLIMGINESFFYPPFRSFDYNLLDVYFAMNEIDINLQNKYGGFIKTVFNVEFFRDSLHSTSNGISEDLKLLIANHENVVVATTMQVSESLFSQWGAEEVNKFVLGVIKVAKENSSDLIILKGKKNELSHLQKSIVSQLDKLDNVFVIHSKKPRYLKYNQFEDLLNITDYIISMSHTSTTIWQAIARNIPAIAINDSHPSSFLSEYSFFETQTEHMCDAYEYWKGRENQELAQFFDEIKQRVNIGQSNGLSQIADYISLSIKT